MLEESPTRYSVDVARRYRWIRGDWQLLGWLRPRLRTLPGAPRNPLSTLSRAKILDNLRRSLVPSALLAVLLVGWWTCPVPEWWTWRALAIVALIPVAAQIADWLRRAAERLRAEEPARVASPAGRQAGLLLMQVLQTLACLPHEAGLQPGRDRPHAVARAAVEAAPARMAALGRCLDRHRARAASPTCCTACARWRSARCSRSRAPSASGCCARPASTRPRRCCCCGRCRRCWSGGSIGRCIASASR
jgi:hypothetical protein